MALIERNKLLKAIAELKVATKYNCLYHIRFPYVFYSTNSQIVDTEGKRYSTVYCQNLLDGRVVDKSQPCYTLENELDFIDKVEDTIENEFKDVGKSFPTWEEFTPLEVDAEVGKLPVEELERLEQEGYKVKV